MLKFKFLFIATLFVITHSIGQTFKPNELAAKLITAFQTKSFEYYKQLLLDTAGYKEMLKDFFKNNHISEADQEEFKEKAKLFADSADILYRKEFERLLDKGVKLGVDWTQIKTAKFIFKADKPVNSDKKALTGYLNFMYKGAIYVFYGIEAVELSTGYKISDIRTILKGSIEQYMEPDLLDNDDL